MCRTPTVSVSRHVRWERWPQRASNPDVGPLDAWRDGTQIYGHGLRADEVRYHNPTETVLLRRNHTLVTVLDATTARLSVQNAIRHFGTNQP